jgi:hypothetical protein
MSAEISKPKRASRTRRQALQNLLGDVGTVLPRQEHGTTHRRAQGWYAELVDGRTVFLGDDSTLAAAQIRSLLDE